MKPSLAALALAVATACACHPAPEPEAATPRVSGADTRAPGGSFGGCTGVFTSVFGWAFTCDGTSVLTREGDDREALLRGARESMRGAFAGPVEERHDDVLMSGVRRSGIELSLRTARKQLVAVGVAAILETDGGPQRMVACLAGADDASQARCRQQLDELSTLAYTDLPPTGVRLRPRPDPAIAGRPVTAPPDCHLAANDRTGLLDCGDAVLGWSEPSDPKAIPSARDATIADTTQQMRGTYTGAQPPKRSTGACRIEGVATTCTVVRWKESSLTIGSAEVRGHTILEWCLASDATTQRICRDAVDTGR